jgi:hydrogenase maturation protease
VKTLVVGLGNPILGDDGVGWRIASELQRNDSLPANVNIECAALGGISLMESLIGYDRAIIIDSILTHQVPIGTVRCSKLEDLSHLPISHMSSAHDTSLQVAMKMGRALGAHLPDDITVVSVEAEKVYDFSETLSPAVADAVPGAIMLVKQLLSDSLSMEVLETIQKAGF